MSRRILAAFCVLTIALFVGIVLPLGLNNSRHDVVLFSFRAEAAADRYAAEIELALAASPGHSPVTAEALPVARSDDRLGGPEAPVDDVAVYDLNGVEVAASGAEIPIRPVDVAAARRGEVVVRWPDEVGQPRIVLAAPVRDHGQVVGVVAMARSDEQLRYSINRRWINLAVGGGSAAVGAVLMAVLLARWVSRPLRRLESAAAELGSGRLATRARSVHGPPEVRELAATFDEMAARIESLVDGQRAFLADVSHQLRTPLTAMRLRLELLEVDVDGAAADDVAGTLAELRRLSRLLDGLLAVSRAEYSPQPSIGVDVAAVVAQRIVAWQGVAQAAGATLSCRTEQPGAATARVTPGHLDQVVDNLVANGLDAAGAAGHVEVTVSRPAAGVVRIIVADDGPGMPPQRRAIAFERFGTRAPGISDGGARPSAVGQADRRGGNGLGLSIVHALVTADGGTITLGEAPAGGLLAVVEVPASPSSGHGGGPVPRQPSASAGERRVPGRHDQIGLADRRPT